jgi:hypothetical protein
VTDRKVFEPKKDEVTGNAKKLHKEEHQVIHSRIMK